MRSTATEAHNPVRRRILQANLAAASLFLPAPYAWVWAQSEGAMKLLRLPKLALVIGNSNYKSAPALGNPGNDAKAIGDTLRQAGFEVTLKLDATRDEMASAMRAHVQMLAARKAVGLFYFAGHGLQLAWRNYLVPVDAVVRKLDDIQSACVDLTGLIEGINKASNPMNVVILDACRENPFGDIRVENRGLSQIDAPHSTLLAYATAPGNVASDGEGVNGLYTENLLREMRVPDAKIEDIFKRVRLHVRRRTNGQQIPWESTSLEEDFYFVPPKALSTQVAQDLEREQREAQAASRKSAAEQADREFETELAIWEKIKTATEPGPLEVYLLRYPTGRFSELAQLRFDQVLARGGEKKIQIVSSAGNPYSKGTAVADTPRKVGDSYTFREMDLYTKIVNRTYTRTITEITDTAVIYSNGFSTDLLGNPLQTPWGTPITPGQLWGAEYAVGKRWASRQKSISRTGVPTQLDLNIQVIKRENITVPAGSFNAFLIEAKGYATGAGVNTLTEQKLWIAPDRVRTPIVSELFQRAVQGRVVASERRELISYHQA